MIWQTVTPPSLFWMILNFPMIPNKNIIDPNLYSPLCKKLFTFLRACEKLLEK